MAFCSNSMPDRKPNPVSSAADQHDLDKLKRWRQSLGDSAGDFPVYAVFLVSEADRMAHDIFRTFRKSFEERNAGFESLVIFGQHGVSEVVYALLAEFGLTTSSLPSLLLIIAPQNSRRYALALHPGEVRPSDPGQLPSPADELLSQVEKLADEVADEMYFEGIAGLTELQCPDEDLAALVERLVKTLGQP